MATYLNEDFKSLPEQVEENKEKIKEIEDTIGGIDPTLISQVHQNTNDIASIKAEQTTQNTAIGGNASNIETLQNKTQYISNDGTTLDTDTDILYVNGNGIEVQSGDVIEIEGTNFDVTIDNGSFKVINNSHTLEFDSNGDLTIDGNSVGGMTLYRHVIFDVNNSFILNIVTTRQQAFTYSDLAQYIYNSGVDSSHSGRKSPFRTDVTYQTSTFYYLGTWSDGTNIYTNRDGGGSVTWGSSIQDDVFPFN